MTKSAPRFMFNGKEWYKVGIRYKRNSSLRWPLIRYLADDTSYFALFKKYVASFVPDLFNIESFQQTIDSQALLIRQYAVASLLGK